MGGGRFRARQLRGVVSAAPSTIGGCGRSRGRLRVRRALSAFLLGSAALVAACGSGTPTRAAGTVTATRMVPGLELLSAIACPTVDWCEAVGATAVNGEGAVMSITQGKSGPRHLVPGTKALTAVSCSSKASCVAVGVGGGHGVIVALQSGSPGSPEPALGMSTFSSLACVGTACEAGGRSQSVGAIASGPSAVLTVPGTTSVNGVDCWRPATCTAIASTSNGKYNDVLVSLFGNSLSPLRIVPPGTSTFGGISCHGSVDCVVVGQGSAKVGNRLVQEAVVVDVESGMPQHLFHLPGSNATALRAVDCPASTVCEAVGATASQGAAGTAQRGVFLAVIGGTPGPLGFVPGKSVELNGISCPSTTLCQAVGENEKTRTGEIVTLAIGG